MNESIAPSTWIVPSNLRTFDAESAFSELAEIDWSATSTAHIRLGDRVLLYATSPLQTLTHECVVTRVGIPFADVIDDSQFWLDRDSFASRSGRTWMRIRLLHVFDPAQRIALHLDRLVEHGLAGAPQGRVRAGQRVLELVEQARALGTDDALESSASEVSAFLAAVTHGNFFVPDSSAERSTRGSAQRVFADLVKQNFDHRCAITGISTKSVLVASHIVPWSLDANIRTDPGNGLLLSALVDKAFEAGLIRISDDLVVEVDFDGLADDPALLEYLRQFHGRSLAKPRHTAINPEHLRRRRALNG